MIPFPPGATGAQRPIVDAYLRPANPNKHVRRTATSVCAGEFDRGAFPAPRAAPVATSSVLTEVVNGAHLRAGRESLGEKPGKARIAESSLVTSTTSMEATAPPLALTSRPPIPWSSSVPNLTDTAAVELYDDVGEYDNGDDWDGDDVFDPVGPVASSPRPLSEVSSILSFGSSRRPMTPFEGDATSPSTTLSPGMPIPDSDYYGSFKGHYDASGFTNFPQYDSYSGTIRPRSNSNATENEDSAKRRKVGRPPKKKKGQGLPVPPPPMKPPPMPLPGDTVVRDCLGRARPARRKSAGRKGWKGWIEVEEDLPPPPTLIKLDSPAEIHEIRRTRSGRHFDA